MFLFADLPKSVQVVMLAEVLVGIGKVCNSYYRSKLRIIFQVDMGEYLGRIFQGLDE
jgi:hypothetical protein